MKYSWLPPPLAVLFIWWVGDRCSLPWLYPVRNTEHARERHTTTHCDHLHLRFHGHIRFSLTRQ